MTPGLLLALKVYALAAAISMAVAAVIKVIAAFAAARTTSAAETQADAALRPDGVPDEAEIAAISAAIATAIGSHRIIHVAERSSGRAWAVEGRTAHHASHQIPRHGAHPPPVKPTR